MIAISTAQTNRKRTNLIRVRKRYALHVAAAIRGFGRGARGDERAPTLCANPEAIPSPIWLYANPNRQPPITKWDARLRLQQPHLTKSLSFRGANVTFDAANFADRA